MSQLQLFRLFDLVTIINLPERGDRLREMQEQLHRVGMEMSGSVELFPAARPAGKAGFPTRGAHGCFLSHRGCIERALASRARALLVLEDDVDFVPDFTSLQASVARRLEDERWDFFYGGGRPLWLRKQGPEESGIASGLCPLKPDIRINCTHFVGIAGGQLRPLHDYLSAMLRRPRGHPEGGPMDVDGAYSWYRLQVGARTFLAVPELGRQRSSASDVRPAWRDWLPGFRHVSPWLRQKARRLHGRG